MRPAPLLFMLGALLAMALFVQGMKKQRRAPETDTVTHELESGSPGSAPRGPLPSSAKAGLPPSSPLPVEPSEARQVAELRLKEAELTLAQYVQSTRYPPDSRPLREHPDRIYPMAPVGRTLPLVHRGQASADVQVKLTQDRLGITGRESARLEVRCEDSLHATVPCGIQGARAMLPAHLPADRSGRFQPTAVEFSDDGKGSHVATFQPIAQGFAGYSGPLRVAFTVRAGEEAGELFFDLLYVASPPARLTGKVREAVEKGSLSLYVEVEVKRAGRYVVTGRVDDNRDRPFAYAQWNDALAEGLREVKLTVFGKLIRDESPEWPLKLRDVDGFLLFEDRDPDREELPVLAGLVYRSQPHIASEFSADEWQSEDRERHVKEFSKDVAEAKSQLDGAK